MEGRGKKKGRRRREEDRDGVPWKILGRKKSDLELGRSRLVGLKLGKEVGNLPEGSREGIQGSKKWGVREGGGWELCR